jgi:hypothetical protein
MNHHLANHVHHWAAMLSVAIGVFTALAVSMWAAIWGEKSDPKH